MKVKTFKFCGVDDHQIDKAIQGWLNSVKGEVLFIKHAACGAHQSILYVTIYYRE